MLTDAERKMLQKIKVKSKNKMIRDIATLKREMDAEMMIIARMHEMCDYVSKASGLSYKQVVELVKKYLSE